MDKFSDFNIDNFKKWIRNQDDMESVQMNKPIQQGLAVESKVSIKHLHPQITTDNDVDLIAEDFVKNGGIIKDVDGISFLIEVESGSFWINRRYVKRA